MLKSFNQASSRLLSLFLAGALLLANALPGAVASDAEMLLQQELLQPLLERYRHTKHELGNDRYVGLVNYRQPSWEPRFYLIDPQQEKIISAYRVAHGKASDPDHDGIAEYFSDRHGSHMSSLGFFLTENVYISQQLGHGLSLRLRGLSPSNQNAYERHLVIHANYYMKQDFIDRFGKPGRSHGCLVLAPADRDKLVAKLEGGALIYAVY